MAINVTYQVPASLLQQQRQAERRAYKRQVNLMTMQQNFQREQAAANRDFQRETMETAYKHQAEKLADERQYQQQQQTHKEQREDSLRQQATQLAQEQQARQQIQQNMTMAWQTSEKRRQALEKEYTYSDAQQMELKQIAADEKEAYQRYRDGLDTPEQYNMALQQLRARRMDIMPETPRPHEETMSVEERLKASTWTDPKGNCWYFDKNGEPKIAMPPNGSVSEKLITARGNAILEAAKSSIAKETGVINKETYQFLKKELEANFATGDEPAEQPKFSVPQTGSDYIKQNRGGGNPLQQMMGQQQPQMPQQPQEQPQPQSQPMQTPEEIQQLEKKIEDAAAEQLSRWKADARKQAKANFLRKRQGGEDIDSAKRQYREHMKSIDDATEIPRTKQTKQAEQPKKEEPKRQTTSVTFNGISDINGLKAWVNGKRLAVGDEMPGGGKITDLDFDNGTLTYELDGKKYTIRKSRNTQNI